MPKSNRSYWRSKLLLNRDRDRRNKEALESLGWRVMVVWECEVKDIGKLKKRLTAFLGRG
jgi:DNA mismatch endonuclease (patch repair protein)